MTAQRDPTDIASAERARRDEIRRERNARLTELADIKRLMDTRWGRRLMWRLLSTTGVYRTVFSTNSMQMAFNEGTRQVGLVLLADVTEVATDAHTLMTKENTIGSDPADERQPDQ